MIQGRKIVLDEDMNIACGYIRDQRQQQVSAQGAHGDIELEKGELRPEVLVEPELREGEVVMVFQVRIVVLRKELFERQKRQARE